MRYHSDKHNFILSCDNSLRKSCLSRQPTGVGETVAALFGDNDMIKKPDSQDFAGVADTFGQSDVFLAGRRVARDMVMAQYNGSGVDKDCGFEDL